MVIQVYSRRGLPLSAIEVVKLTDAASHKVEFTLNLTHQPVVSSSMSPLFLQYRYDWSRLRIRKVYSQLSAT